MEFLPPLQAGTLQKRTKRFIAEVELEGGKSVLAHCPNTGVMIGLTHPGTRVWVSHHPHKKGRKFAYTLEIVEEGAAFIGVNTQTPNVLVREACLSALETEKMFLPWTGFTGLRSEISVERSRLDFLFTGPNGMAYVEVKNVHWKRGTTAFFPDTPTSRGTKHVNLLKKLVAPGVRSLMIYVIQRGDCDSFAVASDVDPQYDRSCTEAGGIARDGVEFFAYTCRITPQSIALDAAVPVLSFLSAT